MAEIKLTINGKECTAPAGSTILQAAERNGIHIPKLCYLEGNPPIWRLPDLCGGTDQPSCKEFAGLLHGGGPERYGY